MWFKLNVCFIFGLFCIWEFGFVVFKLLNFVKFLFGIKVNDVKLKIMVDILVICYFNYKLFFIEERCVIF